MKMYIKYIQENKSTVTYLTINIAITTKTITLRGFRGHLQLVGGLWSLRPPSWSLRSGEVSRGERRPSGLRAPTCPPSKAQPDAPNYGLV